MNGELAAREEAIARKTIDESGGEVVELTSAERTAFMQTVEPLYNEARSRFGDMFTLLD